MTVDFYNTNSAVETWTYAPGVKALPYWINSLISEDASGFNGLNGLSKIYIYFPTVMPTGWAVAPTHWQAFTTEEVAFARQQLQYVSSLIDVTFEEVDGANYQNYENIFIFAKRDIGFGGGLTYYDASTAKQFFVDYSYDGFGGVNNWILKNDDLFLHEVGHALGLKHPFSEDDPTNTRHEDILPTSEDNDFNSIMSYTSYTVNGVPQQNGNAFEKIDIATLQYLYGVAGSSRSGNDTYAVSSTVTNFIWDGAGVDTLDASALNTTVNLSLEEGSWGYVGSSKSDLITAAGQVTINIGTQIENLKGGSAADVLTGNSLANIIEGGAGNDVLQGGAGDDQLIGGDGTDTACYLLDRAQYQITTNNDGSMTVRALSGDEGIDTLSGIESLEFNGTTLGVTQLGANGTNGLPNGRVQILGDAVQGQVLQADVSSLSDINGLGIFNYQWKADGKLIQNGGGSTLLLLQQDVGKAISVEVSYLDGAGNMEHLVSDATRSVLNINDLPEGAINFSVGSNSSPTTVKVGDAVTASITGLADADGVDLNQLSYQWYVRTYDINGNDRGSAMTAIQGATSLMYTPTTDQLPISLVSGGNTYTKYQALVFDASYIDSFGTVEHLMSNSIKVMPA